MKKTCKIVVPGSYISDITAFVDKFPRDGESVIAQSLNFGPGGKGSNQATSASRSGGEVIMITKTGNDTMANVQKEHYAKEGMTEKYIYRTDDAPTGTGIMNVSTVTGENRIVMTKGANELLTPADLEAAEEEFATCDVVLTQLETNDEVVKKAIELANKHGKYMILNPAPAQPVPADFFEGVDYFTPNETEAEFYSGIKVETVEDAEKAAEILIGKGIKNVIITLGKKGAFFSNGKEKLLVPPTDLKAVDTTGAGDAFNGGFAVALAEGKDIETAIKFANCVASISVTRKGASPAMPTREESDALLESFYGIKNS